MVIRMLMLPSYSWRWLIKLTGRYWSGKHYDQKAFSSTSGIRLEISLPILAFAFYIPHLLFLHSTGLPSSHPHAVSGNYCMWQAIIANVSTALCNCCRERCLMACLVGQHILLSGEGLLQGVEEKCGLRLETKDGSVDHASPAIH